MEILRELWFASASGPELLFSIRMGVAAILIPALGMALWAVVWPAEREATWDAAQYRRARFMNGWRVLGLGLLLFYLFTAGGLEVERTSSPYRLLFANAGQAVIGAWHLFDLIFWRWHYTRKPVVTAEKRMSAEKRAT